MNMYERHAALEAIEADAWSDLYAAAPETYVSRYNLLHRRFGLAACLAHNQLISPEFARVVGAASVGELRAAMDWMETNATPGWVVQIPEHEGTGDLQHLVGSKGYARRGNGWAKFEYVSAPQEAKLDPSISVREVFADQATAFGETVQSGFGLPEDTVPWFAQLPGRPNWSTFLAYHNDTPVACGSMYVKGIVAWLGIGATQQEFRGRGAQSLLLRARLAHGRQLGASLFTAEAGQPEPGKENEQKSYSNCRKAGFEPVYVRSNYALPG